MGSDPLCEILETGKSLKEQSIGIIGIAAKTLLSPQRVEEYILGPNMSDHDLRTQILVTPNSVLQCGNNFMIFL